MFNYTTSATPESRRSDSTPTSSKRATFKHKLQEIKTLLYWITSWHIDSANCRLAPMEWFGMHLSRNLRFKHRCQRTEPGKQFNSQDFLSCTGSQSNNGEECLPTQRNRRPEKAHEGTILPFCAWVVLFFQQHAHQHPEMCQKDPEGKEFFYCAMVESRHMGNGHPMSSLCWTNKCFKQIPGWNDHHPLWQSNNPDLFENISQVHFEWSLDFYPNELARVLRTHNV